jgi:hypothetical protein
MNRILGLLRSVAAVLISGVSEKLISWDFQLSVIKAASFFEKFGINNLDYQNSAPRRLGPYHQICGD